MAIQRFGQTGPIGPEETQGSKLSPIMQNTQLPEKLSAPTISKLETNTMPGQPEHLPPTIVAITQAAALLSSLRPKS